MTKLKPCPFCGSIVEITMCTANTAKRIVRATYECDGCGAKISLKTKYENKPITAIDAAWNRRAENEKA